MKRIICTTIVLLALAAFSPAPIGDKGNLRATPERSQGQVSDEQARFQMVQGETTEVPVDTDNEYADGVASDANGKNALSAAALQQQSAQAKQVLAEAVNGAKSRSGTTWAWLLALAAAFGAVLVFRAWMNRMAPVPQDFAGPSKRF